MLTFTLDNAERACDAGGDQARSLFEAGRAYTLPEIIDAGLGLDHLAWLLFERAKHDAATIPLIQAWARACCKQQKLRNQTFDTPANCGAAITAAVRRWAKDKPTSKGGRQWAHQVLIDLIHSEVY